MQDFSNKKIIIGVCGGVAVYKIGYLIRQLTTLGAEVRVVMTRAAQEFISPLMFQALSGYEVRSELFDSQAERAMGHIELTRWADYLVVAPASAKFLAKMSQGIADDLLSTLYLACEIPVIICPAMNRIMWKHPATQENCRILEKRGVLIVGPDEGYQACGEIGLGRLTEVTRIINAIRLYDIKDSLRDKHVLITAGPTREMIDPVRCITNESSGKMGYALAEACLIAGAQVTLVSGPTHLVAPTGVEIYRAESGKAMHDLVMEKFQPGMIFIGAAAVTDYRVEKQAKQKIKKQQHQELQLTLIPNPDILAEVSASKKGSFVVGFAAETQDLHQHAREKFERKNLDMIIANEVGVDKGFNADVNQALVITHFEEYDLPLTHKTRLAGQIISIIAATLEHTTTLKLKEK